MSYNKRTTAIFPSSVTGSLSSRPGNQSSSLAALVAAKRAELEDIRQLRDASNTLTTQLEALEAKLATLQDGAEAVACIMANFDSVLKVINIAAGGLPQAKNQETSSTVNSQERSAKENEIVKDSLPVPLVRILLEQPASGIKR
ncbi:DASH complex subunit dad2 [Microsporum ferrugineum]